MNEILGSPRRSHQDIRPAFGHKDADGGAFDTNTLTFLAPHSGSNNEWTRNDWHEEAGAFGTWYADVTSSSYDMPGPTTADELPDDCSNQARFLTYPVSEPAGAKLTGH